MTLRRAGTLVGAALLVLLPVVPATAQPRLEAVVRLDSLEAGELRLHLKFIDSDRAVRRLRGVPTYVNNPVPVGRGEVVRQLRLSSGGTERKGTFSRTEGGEPRWTFTGSGDTLEVDYRLLVEFEPGPMVERYRVHVPGVQDGRVWLSGNLVFLTPELGPDRVADLRQDMDVRLRFELPAGTALHGPPSDVRLRNLHELLSLQFGIGDFEEAPITGPGWKAQLIIGDPVEFTRAERVNLLGAMRTIVDLGYELFGGVPFESLGLYAFRDEGIGGLEGAWACQAYLPPSVDLTDLSDPMSRIFLMVVTHEAFHTWMPIALFGLDDPWLKEGLTSHYGHVLAARAGWIEPAALEAMFDDYGRLVAGDPGLEPVSLGDPRIWYEEYSGERWRRLTYDRGHAVALLLDVYLREATGNRRSLDDAVRRLFREYRRSSFDRAGLLTAIEAATGVTAAEFFADRVDGTQPPNPEEVERALRRAIELGVYGPR